MTAVSGGGVPDVIVDYFDAQADGSRGSWLGAERTDDKGHFDRSLRPGCYVLVAIAPPGTDFPDRGRWYQQQLCVDPGITTNLDIQLNTGTIQGQLGGSVTAVSGGGVPDVIVDYFDAQADGSRGSWLGAERTDDKGHFDRSLRPGCYVLVAIAPPGTDFPDRGRWYQQQLCVDPGITTNLDIQLDTGTEPRRCTIAGVPVDTPLTASECAALQSLYLSTGGPDWTDNAGWGTPTDPCTWFGVTCESGQVASLRLRGNNLAGQLPPELGDLIGLRELAIFENTSGPPGFRGDLGGPIPATLGRLTELRRLELSNNNLVGPLPSELGQLAQLESLSVRRNRLDGQLPPEIAQLRMLSNLQLDSNQFTGGIPAIYGELTSLRFLDLQWNRLSGELPAELGSLAALEVLQVRGNAFTGSLSATIGDLVNLRAFTLSGNQLSGDMTDAMAGLRAANPSISLDVVGSPPTNCLSVAGDEVADWVRSRDSDWEQCTR